MSLVKKLINFEYFETEVPMKHPNNIRFSEESSELKIDFGVISIWLIVKAVYMDGNTGERKDKEQKYNLEKCRPPRGSQKEEHK